MGEGTKHASGGLPGKFIEQINYQEIDEGEVSLLLRRQTWELAIT